MGYTYAARCGSGGMADTQRSGRCEDNLMRVQLPPSAPECRIDPKDSTPVGSREILRGKAKNK